MNQQTVEVYREPGRYAGWPANHGIWSWGEEILVGFGCGYMGDSDQRRRFHLIDHRRPETHLLARSLDGGETWAIEDPSERGDLIAAGTSLHGCKPEGLPERPWRECPGGIPFNHPDFALTLRMTATGSGKSRFYYSTDRGHNWDGPFELPLFGLQGVAARTDYLVESLDECLIFLTGAKSNGREGRPFMARTRDGGASWEGPFWIMGEPPERGFAIMPSTVRVGPERLLTCIRRRRGRFHWLELYESYDRGETWVFEEIPVEDTGKGNPATLTKLDGDRVALIWGQRSERFGMKATILLDQGRGWETWTREFLGQEAGGHDIGYPQTVLRPDGKLVTVYYTHDEPESERYIAATIWDPETVEVE